MPLPKGTIVEDYLETTLKSLLVEHTRPIQLPRSEASFKWIVEREDVPTPPYGKLKKASQARFGNGVPVIRKRADGSSYREQEWRITLELFFEAPTTRTVGKPEAASVIGGMLDDLFMTPEGRAELSAKGIDYIRLTDEGDTKDGEKYSFDCMTEVWLTDPTVAEEPATIG